MSDRFLTPGSYGNLSFKNKKRKSEFFTYSIKLRGVSK